MLHSSEVILRSALERKESRGSHWRLDYLEEDPYWAKHNIIASLSGDEIVLSHKPIEDMPTELSDILEDGA
jgi:succinate dehydrogenase / fumarate reductase flavoprotein subunit